MKSYRISGPAQLMSLSFNTLFLVIVGNVGTENLIIWKGSLPGICLKTGREGQKEEKKLKVKMGLIKILQVSVRETLLKSD